MSLAIGKARALQQLLQNGRFKVVAIDHRDVFVEMMKSANHYKSIESVTNEKIEIIKVCRDYASGFLIDPHYALPKCILDYEIPGNVGFMVNIEDNDYSEKAIKGEYFIKDFSPEKVKRMGASAVKMFIYYNPESEQVSVYEEMINKIAESCLKVELPFLIEPVLFSLDDKPISASERVRLTYLTIERLKKFKIDIFKIDFPGNVNEYSNEENIKICSKISEMLNVPWVIMSSGIDEVTFLRQLELACQGGASGYVVGRVLWKQFVICKDEERDKYRKEMPIILNKFNEVVDKYAKPVTDIVQFTEKYNQTDWYQKY